MTIPVHSAVSMYLLHIYWMAFPLSLFDWKACRLRKQMRNFLWSRFRYEFRYYKECAIRAKILKFARFVEPEPSFNSIGLSRFSLGYFQPFFWFYPVQHCLSYGLSNHFVHEVACWPKASEINIDLISRSFRGRLRQKSIYAAINPDHPLLF